MITDQQVDGPPLAVGLDVGGTKVAAGVVTADGAILDRVVVPTPHDDDPGAVLRLLTDLTERLAGRHRGVAAVGVGAAGLVEWPIGHIRWAPNNSYRDLALQDLLSAATGLPTVVENDANAAAWAEARVGVGAGHRNVIMLTVGTGIGGGLVIDGCLHRGHTGIGGEIGHLLIDPAGEVCGCGLRGCLETVASGSALSRAARAAGRREPSGLLATLAGDAEGITGETAFAAAEQGDTTACALFDRLGHWLGAGIASLVTIFDPEVVVLAGGLVRTGDLLLVPTRASLHRFVFAARHRVVPPVRLAGLGVDAGLIGAALLALDRSRSGGLPPPSAGAGAASGARCEPDLVAP